MVDLSLPNVQRVDIPDGQVFRIYDSNGKYLWTMDEWHGCEINFSGSKFQLGYSLSSKDVFVVNGGCPWTIKKGTTTKKSGTYNTGDGKTGVRYTSLGSGDGVFKLDGELTGFGYCTCYKCDYISSVKVSNTITSIGDGAFQDSSITSFDITGVEPPTRIDVDESAFYGATDLQYFRINNGLKPGKNPWDIDAYWTTLYTDTGSFHHCDSLNEIQATLVPGGTYTFRGCDHQYISLKNGMTTFTQGCFTMNNYLNNVHVPPSVTTFDAYCFHECYALNKMYFYSKTPPSSVDSLTFNDNTQDITMYIPSGANKSTWASAWEDAETSDVGIYFEYWTPTTI